VRRLAAYARANTRNPNAIAYAAMLVGALVYPAIVQFLSGGNGDAQVGVAADAGVFVLLAIGLNVVVGFAGLLDLGYAAFFAIGAYTYAMIASNELATSPLQHAIHIPFWLALFVGLFVAALAGVLLGAPTLRLRGDYLAIVTLGFGEIVPRVYRNLNVWTGGVFGISAIDPPTVPRWLGGPWSGDPFGVITDLQLTSANLTGFYIVIVIIIIGVVILVRNLEHSRLGRAWMAIREDETAAAATGVNTVNIKLLAFAIGASTSGFAGAFYGAKLSVVNSDQFSFVISITVLSMVVLGGMGNIPGAMIGGLVLYFILYKFLPDAPNQVASLAQSVGLGSLNDTNANGWPGLGEEVRRLQFIVFGLILVSIMLFRPQGLLPNRARRQELGTDEVAGIGVSRELQS
jgi:branched-chain amino acid transport system permease protein